MPVGQMGAADEDLLHALTTVFPQNQISNSPLSSPFISYRSSAKII